MNILIKKIFYIYLILFFVLTLISNIPYDGVYFRNWEEMLWISRFKNTIGKFYPNMKNRSVEYGDLGHDTPYQQAKKVYWETDSNGFRNIARFHPDYKVVIIGDSNAVGCGTTQENTLPNKLETITGVQVFNYSPMSFNKKFSINMSSLNLNPRLVILQSIEREIKNIKFDDQVHSKYNFSLRDETKFYLDELNLFPLVIFIDRVYKKEPINFVKSKIRKLLSDDFSLPTIVGKENVLFYQKSFFEYEFSEIEVKNIAIEIKKISDFFERKGINFIFLPVPNKCSIYFELLPLREKFKFKNKNFLIKLKKELDLLSVDSIDTYSYFRDQFIHGKRMYFNDDTHWNSLGIGMSAELISGEVKTLLENK